MTNEFENLLKECLELHNKKAHDYSKDDDKYSNFKRAAEIVSWFKNPIDQVFACMIGIKLARQAELRNGKVPNNESSRDTGLDLVNYAGLWQSYYDSENDKFKEAWLGEPTIEAYESIQKLANMISGKGIPIEQHNCNVCDLTFTHLDDRVKHEKLYHPEFVESCNTRTAPLTDDDIPF